jgi:hypothetical protein
VYIDARSIIIPIRLQFLGKYCVEKSQKKNVKILGNAATQQLAGIEGVADLGDYAQSVYTTEKHHCWVLRLEYMIVIYYHYRYCYLTDSASASGSAAGSAPSSSSPSTSASTFYSFPETSSQALSSLVNEAKMALVGMRKSPARKHGAMTGKGKLTELQQKLVNELEENLGRSNLVHKILSEMIRNAL